MCVVGEKISIYNIIIITAVAKHSLWRFQPVWSVLRKVTLCLMKDYLLQCEVSFFAVRSATFGLCCV